MHRLETLAVRGEDDAADLRQRPAGEDEDQYVAAAEEPHREERDRRLYHQEQSKKRQHQGELREGQHHRHDRLVHHPLHLDEDHLGEVCAVAAQKPRVGLAQIVLHQPAREAVGPHVGEAGDGIDRDQPDAEAENDEPEDAEAEEDQESMGVLKPSPS